MINLIATDMDGTLLNAAHEISEENINAIHYAQSLGITVVIATGRAFYEASTPVAQTDLKVPYICLNGAEVRDESFNISSTSNLNRELIDRITGELNGEDIYYQIYTNIGIYTENPERDLEIYIDIAERAGQQADVEKIKAGIQKRIDNGTLKVVENYDKIKKLGEIVMKILAFDSDLEKIDRVSAKLAESGSLAVSSSSRILKSHMRMLKSALATIAEKLHIDMDNVMAMGDNLNDISMLERVGYPVAMSNGTEEVKAASKYITETNENSGVSKAIMKCLQNVTNNTMR